MQIRLPYVCFRPKADTTTWFKQVGGASIISIIVDLTPDMPEERNIDLLFEIRSENNHPMVALQSPQQEVCPNICETAVAVIVFAALAE